MATRLKAGASCPVCSSDHTCWVPGTTRPSECRDCGHGDASHSVRTGEVVNQDPERPPPPRPSLLHRDQLRIVAPFVHAGSPLIDIGCSSGTFLRHAVDVLDVSPLSYGVEISEPNRLAAQRAGVTVERAVTVVPSGAVVTMWHSAEHFPLAELTVVLTDLRERSDETVRLIVSVPNGASVQWKLFKDRWTYYDPGAHFSQFSPRSLDMVVGRAGWRAVATARTPVYGGFGAVQSSINLVRPHNELYLALKRGQGQLSSGQKAKSIGAAILTAPVALTVALAEIVPRRASVLTQVFAPA